VTGGCERLLVVRAAIVNTIAAVPVAISAEMCNTEHAVRPWSQGPHCSIGRHCIAKGADMDRRALGVLMMGVLVCAGCTRDSEDFDTQVRFEFRATVSEEGHVLGYALVIDGASWERLTNARGRSRAAVKKDTNTALDAFIQANLDTINGCAGLPWHYSQIGRVSDGSLRLELQCGPGFSGGPLVDIETADAMAALSEWSRQSNQQLLFDASVVRGRHTRAVTGIPTEALKSLLKGTGLVARVVDERTWTVTAADRLPRNGI
jgi:hypothetical protein